MPRLSLLNRDDLPPADRKYYDAIQEARGLDPSDRRITMPPVYSIMLRSPHLASLVAGMPVPIRAGSTLSQEVQEIVVLTVAREMMAPLQWDFHVLRGRDAGVRDAVILSIRDHNVTHLTPRERALVDLTVRQIQGRVDDAACAAVTKHFDERALVEIMVLVGFTTMLIQIVGALDIRSTTDVDIKLPPAAKNPPPLWSSGRA